MRLENLLKCMLVLTSSISLFSCDKYSSKYLPTSSADSVLFISDKIIDNEVEKISEITSGKGSTLIDFKNGAQEKNITLKLLSDEASFSTKAVNSFIENINHLKIEVTDKTNKFSIKIPKENLNSDYTYTLNLKGLEQDKPLSFNIKSVDKNYNVSSGKFETKADEKQNEAFNIPVSKTFGSEFIVNKTTKGNQSASSPIMYDDGSFIVVWYSFAERNPNPYCSPTVDQNSAIYAQKFTYDGKPDGNEIILNEGKSYSYRNTVIRIGDNKFVLAINKGGRSYAQIFDNNLLPVGNMFEISSRGRFHSISPDKGNGFMVTFESNNMQSISVKKYNGNGNLVYEVIASGAAETEIPQPEPLHNDVQTSSAPHPLCTDFSIKSENSPALIKSDSNIAIDNNGNFMVIWLDPLNGNIFGQLFDSNGQKVGNEFHVDKTPAEYPFGLDLISDNENNYYAFWSRTMTFEGKDGIYARKFDHNAKPLTDDVRINASEFNAHQGNIDAKIDNKGNILATWSLSENKGGLDIFARRFNRNLEPLTSDLEINSYKSLDQTLPEISLNSKGDALITWTSTFTMENFYDPENYNKSQDGDGDGVYAKILSFD